MTIWLAALLSCTIPAKYANEAAVESESVTFYEHIQPLMRTYCTRCHSSAGVAPGDFTEVENVETLANYIWDAIAGERMPPASADPECADYVGSDHLRMNDEDKATIQAWIAGGKIRGEPIAVDETDIITTALPDPDLTIPISSPIFAEF